MSDKTLLSINNVLNFKRTKDLKVGFCQIFPSFDWGPGTGQKQQQQRRRQADLRSLVSSTRVQCQPPTPIITARHSVFCQNCYSDRLGQDEHLDNSAKLVQETIFFD